VIDVRPSSATIVVGDEESLLADRMALRDVNWLSVAEPDSAVEASVRIRYRHDEAPATIVPEAGARARVVFNRAQRAITPGQAAVFYRRDVCLGGGWIEGAKTR
jgi:tRNA-specific 2-thiouridylase